MRTRSFGSAPGFGFGIEWTPILVRLLIVNFAVWFVQVVSSRFGSDHLTEWFAFHSDEVLPWRLWQFVTYMFLHDRSPLHLILNMLWLVMFGGPVERALGSQRFLRYYVLCGVGGSVLSLLPPLQGATTLGASGAVLGVILAFGLLYPDTPVYLLFWFFPVPAKVLVFFLALFNLMSVMAVVQDGTAYIAHVGGMAAGYVMLRGGPLGRRLRRGWRVRVEAQRKARREELRGRIDTILDKLHREGRASLTREEWNTLLEESKRVHRE